MKRVLVCLPDGVWNLIEREFKGKLGESNSEVLRAIIIAYLAERGLLEELRGGGQDATRKE